MAGWQEVQVKFLEVSWETFKTLSEKYTDKFDAENLILTFRNINTNKVAKILDEIGSNKEFELIFRSRPSQG